MTSECWIDPNPNDKGLYRCSVCKELGFSSSYSTCVKQSKQILHDVCKKPKDILRHRFFPGCNFRFLTSREGGCYSCDACGGRIKGCFYRCSDKNLDLHPCCANVKHRILVQAEEPGNVTLVLKKESSSKCNICGKKKPSWMYVSECEQYHLHISCAMEFIRENPAEKHSRRSGRRVAASVEANQSRALEKRLHELPVFLPKKDSKTKKKFAKFMKIAKIAITFIVAAVLGDPTTLVAGLLVNIFTN